MFSGNRVTNKVGINVLQQRRYIFQIFIYFCYLWNLLNQGNILYLLNDINQRNIKHSQTMNQKPETKAATGGVMWKKIFWKILQNSEESTCVGVCFLIQLQALGQRLQHRCFPVNFAKFLRTHFLQNTSGRLLLQRHILAPVKHLLWIFFRKKLTTFGR